MATGARIEEIRGFETLARRTELTALLATTPPVAIDPDDAAATGTSGTAARSDHQHAIVTNVASALTKTATSTEGTDAFARNDHLHATSVLPWGIVARQSLTTSSSGFTTNATTDMAISGVVVDSTRLYEVYAHSEWVVTAGAVWDVEFYVDAVLTDTLQNINTAGAISDTMSATILWTPTSGTKNVDIRVVEVGGTATLTFNGSATGQRHFWIKDIGLR